MSELKTIDLNAELLKNYTYASWVKMDKPLSLELYKSWISEGMHGEMLYLKNHIPQKENPELLLPKVKSALVVIQRYIPHPKPHAALGKIKNQRIALYAKGEDYHFWFKENLKSTAEALKAAYPEEDFLTFTDSSPVLERDLARRAGVGWVGKNTCLINKKYGSLFFIGEIYSTREIQDTPTLSHDFCGNCTRCIDSCPTNAIVEPRKLDARKCISYWTIESRQAPPEQMRGGLHDWLFGCDICQTVCPWNEKAFKHTIQFENQNMLELNTTDNENIKVEFINELKWILESSNKSLEKHFYGSALSRAGGNNLKRNAIIVIANHKLNSLSEVVAKYKDHPRLGEISRWCLKKINM